MYSVEDPKVYCYVTEETANNKKFYDTHVYDYVTFSPAPCSSAAVASKLSLNEEELWASVQNALKQSPSSLSAESSSSGSSSWVARMQNALSLADPLARRAVFMEVFLSFQECAVASSLTILAELTKSDSERTIQSKALGGIAGGSKFVHNGILFKAATDPEIRSKEYLYGGSTPNIERANKAASNELKGCNAYFRFFYHNHLPVYQPFQLLIDWGGFRLIAMPLVPIGAGSQLVYGSADAGRTVYASDPLLNQIMQLAGRDLHLACHQVGNQHLWAAGDVEAHIGSDKRFWLLDLARTFPPEHPPAHLNSSRSSVFFRLLRPEFLAQLKRMKFASLSSDVLTGWGQGYSDTSFHTANVMKANDFLLFDANGPVNCLVKSLITLYKEDCFDMKRVKSYFNDVNPALQKALANGRWSVNHVGRGVIDGVQLWTKIQLDLTYEWTGTGPSPQSLECPMWMRKQFNTLQTEEGLNLSQEFHRFGVSLRHLGLVRQRINQQLSSSSSSSSSSSNSGSSISNNGSSSSSNSDVSDVKEEKNEDNLLSRLLLLEMVMRSLKNQFREHFRVEIGGADTVRQEKKSPSSVATEFLSSVTAAGASGGGAAGGLAVESPWGAHLVQDIKERFGQLALSETESQPFFLFKNFQNDSQRIISYLCRTTGVKLSERVEHKKTPMALHRVFSPGSSELVRDPLQDLHVKGVGVRLKTMSFLDGVRAKWLTDLAMRSQHNITVFVEYITQATSVVRIALASYPLDESLNKLLHTCECCLLLAQDPASPALRDPNSPALRQQLVDIYTDFLDCDNLLNDTAASSSASSSASSFAASASSASFLPESSHDVYCHDLLRVMCCVRARDLQLSSKGSESADVNLFPPLSVRDMSLQSPSINNSTPTTPTNFNFSSPSRDSASSCSSCPTDISLFPYSTITTDTSLFHFPNALTSSVTTTTTNTITPSNTASTFVTSPLFIETPSNPKCNETFFTTSTSTVTTTTAIAAAAAATMSMPNVSPTSTTDFSFAAPSSLPSANMSCGSSRNSLIPSMLAIAASLSDSPMLAQFLIANSGYCAKGMESSPELQEFLDRETDLPLRSTVKAFPTALMLACEANHIHFAKVLIAFRAMVWPPTPYRSPLSFAAEQGHFELVQFLLTCVPTSDVRSSSSSTTSFSSLPSQSSPLMSLRINQTDTTGRNALMLAVWSGSKEVVSLLLHHKGDAFGQDRGGGTCLQYACSQGNFDLVYVLLNHFCEAVPVELFSHMEQMEGEEADLEKITMASANIKRSGHQREVLAQINRSDRRGMTPLHWACKNRRWAVALLLLDLGAKSRRTALAFSRESKAKQESVDSDFPAHPSADSHLYNLVVSALEERNCSMQ